MNDVDVFEIVKPKTKLFGERAARVTTAEMNAVFTEVKQIFSGDEPLRRMELVKALPSKEDHGDIDIVVESRTDYDLQDYIKDSLDLELKLMEHVENGPILHCLFYSSSIGKEVHVDFIFANSDEYDATRMYLAYNDFSGILGVITRKLKFNYGSKGFFKIYADKKNQFHYILLSRNLVDGLKMLGFADVIDNYYQIKNNDDIAAFIGHSDLFDSNHLVGSDLNRGDRKRMRSGRPSARELKNKLVDLDKRRIQMDDDFYFKTLFPEKYSEYLLKCKEIEDYVPPKSKYNGNWLMKNFTEIKPGPIIGKVQLYWMQRYGDKIDSIDENQLIQDTSKYLAENKS